MLKIFNIIKNKKIKKLIFIKNNILKNNDTFVDKISKSINFNVNNIKIIILY